MGTGKYINTQGGCNFYFLYLIRKGRFMDYHVNMACLNIETGVHVYFMNI